MINPAFILNFRKRKALFDSDHPEFIPFLKDCGKSYFEEGNIVDISIKAQNGEVAHTQLMLNEQDIETFNLLTGSVKVQNGV